MDAVVGLSAAAWSVGLFVCCRTTSFSDIVATTCFPRKVKSLDKQMGTAIVPCTKHGGERSVVQAQTLEETSRASILLLRVTPAQSPFTETNSTDTYNLTFALRGDTVCVDFSLSLENGKASLHPELN